MKANEKTLFKYNIQWSMWIEVTLFYILNWQKVHLFFFSCNITENRNELLANPTYMSDWLSYLTEKKKAHTIPRFSQLAHNYSLTFLYWGSQALISPSIYDFLLPNIFKCKSLGLATTVLIVLYCTLKMRRRDFLASFLNNDHAVENCWFMSLPWN